MYYIHPLYARKKMSPGDENPLGVTVISFERGSKSSKSGTKGGHKKIRSVRVSSWGFYGCVGTLKVYLSAEPSNISTIYHLIQLSICSISKGPKLIT